MEKVYIEAIYRIRNTVFNSGYIRIDDDTISCLFSLDYAYIEFTDGYFHFYLKEYEPENNSYYETKEFIANYDYINILNFPYTYILKNHSGNILTLHFIKRVYDPYLIRNIEKDFQTFFGK